jgi:hypothetical protein
MNTKILSDLKQMPAVQHQTSAGVVNGLAGDTPSKVSGGNTSFQITDRKLVSL